MRDKVFIQNMIRAKEMEIQQLEHRLTEARGYVRGLQELIGVDPGNDRSMVQQARDIILAKGRPAHITELLRAMGRPVTRETRVSLTGALAAYVRRGDTFAKAGPNTFTLVELKRTRKPTKTEPPADFGEMPAETATKRDA